MGGQVMELRHLRYFAAVARERGFGRAASTLNVAQPALSRQVKDLEEEVGVPLLDRGTRGVSVTPAGEALLLRAGEGREVTVVASGRAAGPAAGGSAAGDSAAGDSAAGGSAAGGRA